MTNNYVLYHASCADGFASALAIWEKYRDEFIYIPVQYRDPIPKDIIDDYFRQQATINGRLGSLFIVDFSFDSDKLKILENMFSHIVLIDHHKTAIEKLADFQFGYNNVVILDTNYLGAVLTYSYLNPDKYVPLFYRYIQDRDLWQWQLPDSREFSAGLQLEEMDFKWWDILTSIDGIDKLIENGKIVLKYQQKVVKDLAKYAVLRTDDNGNTFATLNSPVLQSELGHYLCNNKTHTDDSGDTKLVDYADIHFLMYEGDNCKIVHSLRSRDDFDVSVIAKRFGGGGHHSAAGYTS